jgi:precorrin-6A/cobalt-precorrin-6A reductase
MARPLRVLVLGGTSEASRLAEALAPDARYDAVLSYAGRVERPKPQPIRRRVGGFGGVAGLVAYLRAERIDAVVDATHPFAAQMSAHAVAACAEGRVPLVALERPPWVPVDGDDWTEVDDLAAAAEALGAPPRAVFLAVGRLHLDAFAGAPQHRYLVRLVDPPLGPLPLPETTVIVARGPFDAVGDAALMRAHGIEVVVAKNAGGEGARAKIDAARALGLPVVLVRRPPVPERPKVASVAEAMAWLARHSASLRGV